MIIEEQHDSEVVCVTQFEALQKENAAQLAELHRISEVLGTNEGHSSVTHIETLREQLKDCSAVVDRQQVALDRNTEQIAILRFDAERYGRVKQFLQHGNGSTLDARGTDSAAFDALIDALPKEEGK
jgi:hypothetical protein